MKRVWHAIELVEADWYRDIFGNPWPTMITLNSVNCKKDSLSHVTMGNGWKPPSKVSWYACGRAIKPNFDSLTDGLARKARKTACFGIAA